MIIKKTEGLIEVCHNDKLLALIIKNDYHNDGISFFTPDDFSQQVASMKYSQGKEIDAHIHNQVKRSVHYTSEVLIIKNGQLRVDFYDDSREYIESYLLNKGDIILLSSGGHGFKCMSDLDMVEIKQGPYLGNQDKTRFAAVDESEVIINE